MQKRAPTLGNILVILLFVLSCFGLLMFLWESFGGPLPLKPKGYRFTVSFPRALALAEQSDVRISGVDVGHVISINPNPNGRTKATVEIQGQYAPIRENMQAILRQKTLLGETYVQLIPEQQSGPYLPDGGHLPEDQVQPSVTLDDILSAFDPKTRKAFQVWQQAVAEGINGRGEQINSDFASLQPFVEHANQLVSVLDEQEGAVRELVHNTGVVFNALASRDNQLEQFIVNGEHTFSAASSASREFAEAFETLPSFEKHSETALKELDKFSVVANPYLDEFRYTEKQLAALLESAKPFAPQFDKFLTAIGPLTTAAKAGLPKISPILKDTEPVLENLRPVLHNLDPFLQYTGDYLPELQAFFANLSAASQFNAANSNIDGGKGPKQRLLTTMQVLTPESLAIYQKRPGTDRSNPYDLPGAYNSLSTGLSAFSSAACADSAPDINGPPNATGTQELIEEAVEFKLANPPAKAEGFTPSKSYEEAREREKKEAEAKGESSEANKVAAPVCLQQGPFTFNGKTSQFPHTKYEPSEGP